MARTRPLTHPVTVTLDGEPLQAERGEPLAATLLAEGKLTIARSPKFHRPRGPACFRGACDGCLARVDDAPNVMTCTIPAEDGMAIISQNRLGPRDVDLLRMTDWFFPEGMNHHELFAGVPGIQTIMQGFARRVAGLGRLPPASAAPVSPKPRRRSTRRKADVVVVGAGPAGMAVATELVRAGRVVEVIDDQLAPGGSVTALSGESAKSFDRIVRAFEDARAAGNATSLRMRSRTTAGALYGRDLLVADEEGAEVIEARAIVLACGAHDGALAFEGNDVPGVMSARAAGWLFARDGVLVGEKTAVIVSPGGGPFGESFATAVLDYYGAPDAKTKAKAAKAKRTIELVHGEPIAIRGTSRAKGVTVRLLPSGEEKKIDADVVLIDAPRSPAYELCEQAGAKLRHEPRGFIVRTNEGGQIADGGGIWAAGEVCGVELDAEAIQSDAVRVATSVIATS